MSTRALGSWTIGEKLGEGSAGEVYRALRSDGAQGALKLYHNRIRRLSAGRWRRCDTGWRVPPQPDRGAGRGGGGRHAVFGQPAGRGPHARGAAGAGAAVARGGHHAGGGGGRGAGCAPPRGPGPPGHQADQRDRPRPGWPGGGGAGGFRAGGGGRPVDPAHPRRRGVRDARVHVARAGAGSTPKRRQRRLGLGRAVLPFALRPPAVRERFVPGHHGGGGYREAPVPRRVVHRHRRPSGTGTSSGSRPETAIPDGTDVRRGAAPPVAARAAPAGAAVARRGSGPRPSGVDHAAALGLTRGAAPGAAARRPGCPGAGDRRRDRPVEGALTWTVAVLVGLAAATGTWLLLSRLAARSQQQRRHFSGRLQGMRRPAAGS